MKIAYQPYPLYPLPLGKGKGRWWKEGASAPNLPLWGGKGRRHRLKLGDGEER